MTKHSKNNTASSIFSYAEYKRLDYGTKRVGIGISKPKVVNAHHLICFMAIATVGERVYAGI